MFVRNKTTKLFGGVALQAKEGFAAPALGVHKGAKGLSKVQVPGLLVNLPFHPLTAGRPYSGDGHSHQLAISSTDTANTLFRYYALLSACHFI
jgi:hypothetical protein